MKKTGLDQIPSIHFGSESEPWLNASGFEDDPRWQLTQRVVESAQFSKSPRLSSFLLYIVAKFLEGRQREITEQQIGVHVFGRPIGYRTVDDNIVRNYARQLRKRLAEYFASEGIDHTLRIEIPLGGYLPSFATRGESEQQRKPVLVERTVAGAMNVPSPPVVRMRRSWPRMTVGACMLLVYSAMLIWLTSFVTARHAWEPISPLWTAILQGPGNTYIVPPDAGLNLVENLSHRSMALADYLTGRDLDLSLPGINAQSVTVLRTQQLTEFADLQMFATLSRLSEYGPAHVLLRFPRDLRFDDLKNANAVIIGSECSNPWAVIAQSTANFQIHCNPGMQGATIVNLKPQPGEAASYTSYGSEPTHETYAVISYVPNLSGYGKLLFLGGLDEAAIQAAGEELLHSGTITPILQRARQPDGSLAAFEILLGSTSIQANVTETHIIASRIH
jgi:hypothetical protein